MKLANDMTVNDSEMCVRSKDRVNTGDILRIHTKEERKSERDRFSPSCGKARLKDQTHSSLILTLDLTFAP